MNKRIALITGAGKGIGRAIAKKLSEDGIHVIINYNASYDKAKQTEEYIKSIGGSVDLYQCDIKDFNKTKEMIEDILKKFGKIDILINNAGIAKDNLIVKMPKEDFNEVIETNLISVYNTTKFVIKAMAKQKRGVIINIASISGILGIEGQANYSASKAGVIGLTKAVAREVAHRKIRVNAVAPGFIDTEMTMKINDSRKETIINQIPMKRLGNIEEVAELVSFLVSDKAGYITGQTICIDGGFSM